MWVNMKLRILYLEDNPLDVELIEDIFVSGGLYCDLVHVETREDFIEALEHNKFYLILLGHSLPTFDGLSALVIAKEKSPGVPVIIVAAAKNEDLEKEMLRLGATDYVLKDSLSRITFSVRRALREAEEHAKRQEAEKFLSRVLAQHQNITDNLPEMILVLDVHGNVITWNRQVETVTGYSIAELAGKSAVEFLPAEDRTIVIEAIKEAFEKGHKEMEGRLLKKNGRTIPYHWTAVPLKDENDHIIGLIGIGRETTEQKQMEEKLKKAAQEWRDTFDSMPYGVLLHDTEFRILRANNYISALAGMPVTDIIGKHFHEIMRDIKEPLEKYLSVKSEKNRETYSFEFYETKLNKYFMGYNTPIFDKKGSIKTYISSIIDITEIKDKENKLIKSRNAFLNMLKETDFSYKELKELFKGLVEAFANTIDAKSSWTKGHSSRVAQYAIEIAKVMGFKNKDVDSLNIAGLLHDIGKIGTYDIILDKPDKLTSEEFEIVKKHPAHGEQILRPIKQLHHILPIIRHHHERIDGKGYPDGLKGVEIPSGARILHVADSFDSMTADRPYRPSPGKEYAISELKKYSGIQFDAQVVEAFLDIVENITPD